MDNKDLSVIRDLLIHYPDVIENFGGKEIMYNQFILERLAEYINGHKWYMDRKLNYSISMDQAMFSWYENVYRPLVTDISNGGIRTWFRSRKLNAFELFDRVSNEHFYLSQSDENVEYATAYRKILKRA